MLVTVVLGFLGVLRRWLAFSVLGIGIGASLVLTTMAALGVGLFVNAPLMVKVQAKIWLAYGLFAVTTLGALVVAGRWLPERVTVFLQYVVGLGGLAVFFHPLFGYGRLGREMNKAVKEDERATWRN